MHNLRCLTPSGDLQEFVRAYAQREVSDLCGSVHEPIPARLEQVLEFQFGEHFEVANITGHRVTADINLIGSFTEGGCSLALRNRIVSFGIFFQPVGFSRLFRIPAVELSNRAFDGVEILPEAFGRLYERLAASPSFGARVTLVEGFLRELLTQSVQQREDLGCSAADLIFRSNGTVGARALAAHYGLSVRQLERRVTEAVGISPKTYARVARFQTALDTKLLAPRRSWLSIAHYLGYYDQMHMVHDFHDLAGAAPTEILARIRDGRPPAMQNFSEF